jgi:hypothetical protein
MLLPVSIRNRTGSFGWNRRQKRQPRRNSSWDRCLRQRRQRWWLRWPTSGRWQRPRKPSWIGCAVSPSATPSPRLRADGEDRPHPVRARTVRHFWRGQVGDFSTAEFVEDAWDATSVSTGLVKVGDEEYTSLACENLMIAAEALGLTTCPMEGFDGRRLSRFLGLSNPVS